MKDSILNLFNLEYLLNAHYVHENRYVSRHVSFFHGVHVLSNQCAIEAHVEGLYNEILKSRGCSIAFDPLFANN